MTFLRTTILLILFLFQQTRSNGQVTDTVEWARQKVRGGPGNTSIQNISTVKLIGKKTKPVVLVTINGKGPYKMLLDVGANVTILQKSVSDLLKLRVLRAGEQSQLVYVDSIRIGAALFSDIVVGARQWKEDIDGILGFGLFKECLVRFDFPSGNFVISNEHLSEADDKSIFPYHIGEDRCPYFTILVGNDSLEVLLDTGMDGYLDVEVSKEKNFVYSNRSTDTITSSSFNFSGSAIRKILSDKIYIGEYSIENSPIVLSKEEGFRLGCGIFKEFVLGFDQKNKTFSLERKQKKIVL